MVEFSIAESRQLLAQIVDFAAEFSWLYDFHGTQILDCGVLQSLPPDWMSTLAALDAGQLNEIAECQSRSEYPSTMQRFLQLCSKLSIHQLLPDVMDDLPEWKVVGVGQKKRYEVPRLTRLVAEVQQRTLSQVVLDIGSGLGYVDSLLHHELGVRVLGVESQPQRVLSARARHVRECGVDCPHLQYLVWTLHDDRDTVFRAGAIVEQLVDPVRAKEVCVCFKNKDPVCDRQMNKHFCDRHMNKDLCDRLMNKDLCDRHMNKDPVCDRHMNKDNLCDHHKNKGPLFCERQSSKSDLRSEVTPIINATSECAAIDGATQLSTETSGKSLGLLEVTSETAASVSSSSNPVNESVTLLGLHACADLSPTMIRIFMCCNKISSMILLSCCYHKLKPAELEQTSQDSCSKASEDDAEPDVMMTRLSDTSEGYESDVLDDFGKLNRSQALPKFVPIQRNSNPHHLNTGSHVHSRTRRRHSSASKCLFKNFPLSRSGSLLMCQRGFSLSVYGLRLACQQPGSRWRRMRDIEHRTHENALLFRAVLDSVCANHGVDLVKKKRRCANKDQLVSFEHYLNSILKCYDIKSTSSSHSRSPRNSENHTSDEDLFSSSVEPEGTASDPAACIDEFPGKLDTSSHSFSSSSSSQSNPSSDTALTSSYHDDPAPLLGTKTENLNTRSFSTACVDDASLSRLVPALRQCYSQNKHLGPLLEAITGLQLAMQGVLESFVLLDRVLYALESKFCSSVQLTKVFDAAVSPRCAALVLYK
ncbi:Methyltransferase domain [Trinorchestia longiramus]|nr:Methyltransferase domain [Trinorchestia longiramus]